MRVELEDQYKGLCSILDDNHEDKEGESSDGECVDCHDQKDGSIYIDLELG